MGHWYGVYFESSRKVVGEGASEGDGDEAHGGSEVEFDTGVESKFVVGEDVWDTGRRRDSGCGAVEEHVDAEEAAVVDGGEDGFEHARYRLPYPTYIRIKVGDTLLERAVRVDDAVVVLVVVVVMEDTEAEESRAVAVASEFESEVEAAVESVLRHDGALPPDDAFEPLAKVASRCGGDAPDPRATTAPRRFEEASRVIGSESNRLVDRGNQLRDRR